MRRFRLACAALAAGLAIAALPSYAKPAAWYHWKSKLDSHLICVQSYPGGGWEQRDGPYPDHRCVTPTPTPPAQPLVR